MKIALIGYGKMGQTIEEISLKRGHSIEAKIDVENVDDLKHLNKSDVNVAIEFSTPSSASENVKSCISQGIPVVCGTTGWNDRLPEIINYCVKNNGSFFYASNYSIGVNIFFEINKKLAMLINRFEDYSIDMKEIHHIHKKDAPSGTAITLAEGIIENIDRINTWKLGGAGKDEISIKAIREGEVPGTHMVNYDSDLDAITIRHKAKTRKGFALGAVLVSEWIQGRNGFFTMKDFLDL